MAQHAERVWHAQQRGREGGPAAPVSEAGAREVRRATSKEERVGLWKGRKKAFGAMGRIAPDLLVQDATVPRTRLPEVLARFPLRAARYSKYVRGMQGILSL